MSIITNCYLSHKRYIARRLDKIVGEDLRKFSDLPIKVRNKPRPNNEWWGKDIREDLIDCHCLVTNMSLASVDQY